MLQHKFCCPKCHTRTDTNNKAKNRREIKAKWMTDYFELIGVDIISFKFICN